MPKELHSKLKRQAVKKFGTTTSAAAKRYIYGTLQSTKSSSIKIKRKKKKA